MSSSDIRSSSVDASSFAYVVGIDIGSQKCDFCVLKPDKSQVIKPTSFANARSGFEVLQSKLAQLHVPAGRVLIGLEATCRYGENLYQFLEGQGYQLWRLASRANPSVRESLAACARKPISWMLPPLPGSCESRRGTPRLCADRSDCDKLGNWSASIRTSPMKSPAPKTRSTRCSACSFQSSARFSLIRVELLRLSLLTRYPSAQAICSAGVEAIAATLQEVAPGTYGRSTAERLVHLAQHSVSGGWLWSLAPSV